MNIKNAEELRDYLLVQLDKLEKNLIDIDKLSIAAKTSETIMSSLKLQLAYSGMRGETPNIDFLQSCNNNLIE